jgi:hypothetical protein
MPGLFAATLNAPAGRSFSVDREIPPPAGRHRYDQQSLHVLHEPGEKLKECRIVAVMHVLDVPQS